MKKHSKFLTVIALGYGAVGSGTGTDTRQAVLRIVLYPHYSKIGFLSGFYQALQVGREDTLSVLGISWVIVGLLLGYSWVRPNLWSQGVRPMPRASVTKIG